MPHTLENKGRLNPEPLFTLEYLRVMLIHFLVMGSFGIYFFLPRFIRLTGGEEFIIGLTMGAAAVTSLLLRLPAGNWIDRFGRRRLVIGGLALFVIACTMPVLAAGAGAYLFIARGVLGIAVVIYFTAIVTYMAEKAPPARRAEAVAIYGASGFIAQAISPYACEWLLENLPLEPVNRFKVLFVLAGVLALLALVVSLGMETDQHRPEEHKIPDPWPKVIRQPRMVFLIIPSLAFGAGYAAMFNFVADFTEIQHLGPPSNFFVSYSITIIVLRIATGRLLDVIDRRLGVIVSLTIMGVGLVYASFCTGPADLVVVGILTGTGHCYIFPTLSTLTYDSSLPRNRGTSMALYMLGFDMSNMLVSPLLGRLAEHWDYFIMYRVAAGFLLVGVVAYAVGFHHHAPDRLRAHTAKDDPFIKNPGVMR